jgi:hypothetical protein
MQRMRELPGMFSNSKPRRGRLLWLQSSDGGWAAFDVDNIWHIIHKVLFADHNAMLDPTCADITGRVLESLCRRDFRRSFTFNITSIKNSSLYWL